MNLVWFVFYSMHSDCSVHDMHYTYDVVLLYVSSRVRWVHSMTAKKEKAYLQFIILYLYYDVYTCKTSLVYTHTSIVTHTHSQVFVEQQQQ